MVDEIMENAGELLQKIGLSQNEAKAYTALLGCQPATAYEVAKISAIPTSKGTGASHPNVFKVDPSSP